MTKERNLIESELVFGTHPKSKIFKDLTDSKIGRLTVLGFSKRENNRTYWFCKCDCGKIVQCLAGSIMSPKNKNNKSCGCYTIIASTKHGATKNGGSKAYISWAKMRERCLSETCPSYHYYGGRGIKIAKEWDDFNVFLSDMGECPDRHTIDRIDVNGDYEPSNCRWATMKEQQNNRRNNRLITYGGKTQTLAQWGEELRMGHSLIGIRIDRLKWSVEKALITPPRFKTNTHDSKKAIDPR